MAVEARHLNLFPTQLMPNGGIVNSIEVATNIYTTPTGYGIPISGTIAETSLPMYSSAMKAESDLTYNPPVSRKRPRDSINPFIPFPSNASKSNTNNGSNNNYNSNSCAILSFLGEDVSIQILQQQLEIDRFIAQHMEKVRLEIEERRKRHSGRIIAAVEEGMMKRLRAKEEEIEKMGKLNWALEERVKSLCIENQIWKDLAQTNEATANALRTNLELVLAQVKNVRHHGAGLDEAVTDDAESCCGSTGGGCGLGEEREGWRTLAESGGERKVVKDMNSSHDNIRSNRRCRNCRKEESCVLLLPCRHLCLCTVCGSTLHTCPVCKTNKNASVHVNMF